MEIIEDGESLTAEAPLEAAGFTFVQLSDPHLTSLEGVKARDLLSKRLLGYLSWRYKRRKEHSPDVLAALRTDLQALAPEHIVITGDLTHIGLPDEFHQARLWLESLGESRRVTVIPGNHDAYARSRWDSRFTAWRPFMTSEADRVLAEGAWGDGFPCLRLRGAIAFIGLSSARPSPPFFASGRLGESQLARFAKLLELTGSRGLFRVVLLHHPPMPGVEKWRKRLIDASGLCAVLGSQGAELVLHGHTHRSVRTEIGGIPVFSVSSASSLRPQAERRAGYNVYKVVRDLHGWRLEVSVRRYRLDKNRFFQERRQRLVLPLAGAAGSKQARPVGHGVAASEAAPEWP